MVEVNRKRIDIKENCPGIDLNEHSLEIVEELYLGDTIGAKWDVFGSVITRMRSRW